METIFNVHSIFKSIDGEVSPHNQGAFTVFIRFCGCNLRCSYCDTVHAQDERVGKPYSLKEATSEVASYRCRNLTITGGEPLCQPTDLMKEFLGRLHYYFSISVETNGSKDIRPYLGLCRFVMDYKLPSSGMEQHMEYRNFSPLCEQDFVKFVVSDREDFTAALTVKKRLRRSGCRAQIAFSPAYGTLDPITLFDWMEEKRTNGILSLQLHKMFGFL